MRISLVIAEGRRDDALLILETVGFVRDDADVPGAPPGSDRFEIEGELPEKSVAELPAIDGVLDWKILPLEDSAPAADAWPWRQQPETD